MKAATASRPELDFVAPTGVVVAKIDPLTGYLAGPYCPVAMTGVFPKDMAPSATCPFHKSAASTTTTTAVSDQEAETGVDTDTVDTPND